MPNEVMQGVNLADNAFKRMNARTAVLLFENTNAGIGNAQVFKENFIKHGGQVLAEIGFGRDVNDFTSIATRVAGLGKIDVDPDLHPGRAGAEDYAGPRTSWGYQRWRRRCCSDRHDLAAIRLRAEGGKSRFGICTHRAVRSDRGP